jgi:hypothetical protein
MNYQKDLKEIREICEQINDPHICLSWLEDGESLERLGITSIEAVEQVYSEIQAEIIQSRKITVEQVQNQFGGTLTDYQAAVYAERHNCE